MGQPSRPAKSLAGTATLPPLPPSPPLHRSGAVAKMLGMLVATLRVWERRYALTPTARSPGGQRLYSADDVRRLALLRQLIGQGHAIGSLASLGLMQLQQVAASQAQALAATQAARRAGGASAQAPSSAQPWRLVVVGQTLGTRLQRPALLRRLGRPVQLLGPFANVAQAATALAAQADGRPADAWLLHIPQLHAHLNADLPGSVLAAGLAAAQDAQPAPRLARKRVRKPAPTPAPAPGLAPVPVAVFYGYAADAVCDALAASGVALLREPQPDAALAQWLRQWADASAGPAPAPAAALTFASGSNSIAAPRRWDDTALASFAAEPTAVACDCPRHLAELLMQLSRFEAYSAQCQQRGPADAELHAYLGGVAASARVELEAALAQVAQHLGLPLPTSAV